jgi:hypothetical protein
MSKIKKRQKANNGTQNTTQKTKFEHTDPTRRQTALKVEIHAVPAPLVASVVPNI